MRALVTGGAGLIGSHIVDLLLERGHEVVVLDSLEEETHSGKPLWVPSEVNFIHGDIRDKHDVGRALKGCEVVFHQAAYGGFSPHFVKMSDVNCTGTALVMKGAREAGVRKIVIASSQAVYGGGQYKACGAHGGRYRWERSLPDLERGIFDFHCQACDEVCHPPIPLTEDHPTHITTTYAQSKLYSEQLALRLGREWELPVVALRYALTYGPRQSLSNPYAGITSMFANALMEGKPCRVYEDGLQMRDFTFVGDVAEANLLIAESDIGEKPVSNGPAENRFPGCVFNVGTGVGTTILDLISKLADALGVEPSYELSGYRVGDARHVITDATALRWFGWKPKVTLEAGLARYVAWRRE